MPFHDTDVNRKYSELLNGVRMCMQFIPGPFLFHCSVEVAM